VLGFYVRTQMKYVVNQIPLQVSLAVTYPWLCLPEKGRCTGFTHWK